MCEFLHKGHQGSRGSQGPPGKIGPPGAKGDKGSIGQKGEQGVSATSGKIIIGKDQFILYNFQSINSAYQINSLYEIF